MSAKVKHQRVCQMHWRVQLKIWYEEKVGNNGCDGLCITSKETYWSWLKSGRAILVDNAEGRDCRM